MDDIPLLVGLVSSELDDPLYLAKYGVILAHADVGAGVELSSSLSHNDGAWLGQEARKDLDAQSPTGRITSVVGRTPRLLRGETDLMLHLRQSWLQLCGSAEPIRAKR